MSSYPTGYGSVSAILNDQYTESVRRRIQTIPCFLIYKSS